VIPLFLVGAGLGATITPAMAAASPHAATVLAGAFGAVFAVALAITALALIPALLLPGRPAGPPSQPRNT
jgi:hypothetical protein